MPADFTNCSQAFDSGEVNWDVFTTCLPLPLSISLLLALSACWLFFLLVVFFRYFKNRCSVAKGLVIGKKMQVLQTWFYAYLFTLVYITALFTAATLFTQDQTISPILFLFFTFLSIVLVTTVDVVGNESRKSGTNQINFRVALEYVFTLYLPKAVWKIAAHKEEGEAFDGNQGFYMSNGEASSKKTGTLTRIFALEELGNFITPKVYDVKDVVSIFCTFLSIPATAILLVTYLVSDIDISTDNFLLFSFLLFAVTSLLSPLLGDWEALSHEKTITKVQKKIFHTLFYLLKRPVEFIARLSFFVVVITGTRGVCVILFGLEFLFNWWSHLTQFEAPRGGRVRGKFHKIYSSFITIFFGCFRRINVDKHLTVNTNELSVSIELFRYVVKTLSTAVGFLIFVSSRTLFWSESKDWLVYLSLGANVVLVAILVLEFVVMKRSEVKKSEVKSLIEQWRFVCCWMFRPKVEYVDRAKPMADGSFNLV